MDRVVVESSGPDLTDWLAAGASIAAAAAAVVLLVLAFRQMKAAREQAAATNDQVQLLREEAVRSVARQRTQDLDRQTEQNRRDDAVREQLAALRAITEATLASTRAQLQPLVFAHALKGMVRGPDERLNIDSGYVAFEYRLSNEGTGIALNVRHGVELDGVDHEHGDGMEVRVLRAGENDPPIEAATGRLVLMQGFIVVLPAARAEESAGLDARTYWARFENVFGERFETRNPIDPRQSASFMRITQLP